MKAITEQVHIVFFLSFSKTQTVVGGQVLIVEVGGPAFQVVPIGARDWAVSLVLGALSLPVAVLIRLLPPGPFERMMIRFRLYPDPNAPPPTDVLPDEDQEWNAGMQHPHLLRNHRDQSADLLSRFFCFILLSPRYWQGDRQPDDVCRNQSRSRWKGTKDVFGVQEPIAANEAARYSSLLSQYVITFLSEMCLFALG